jgi:DNA (cytosine-5)-methyltransferase 1
MAGPMSQSKSYSMISLFSGGMGLDIGLERTTRFRLLACVEKDKASCETIRINRIEGKRNPPVLIEADICSVDPHQLLDKLGLKPGELDLLVGGPPCQSFSTAGRRGTVQDPRGTLLWQFLRFIEVMKPKFFIMENVRGLLSAAIKHRAIAERPNLGGDNLATDEEPGSVVRAFAADLQELEGVRYRMDCFEVNAVNYGAPQLRERALFIGNRFNESIDFPDPTHGHEAKPHSKGSSTQHDLFAPPPVPLKPWRTLRDALCDLDDSSPVIMDFSPRKKHFLSLVPPGSNWRSLPEALQKESMGKAWFAKGGRSGWWRRLSFELPAPTLVTMPNHASTSLCHPFETRALSVREYARIQEFPDSWFFAGKTSDQYRQVGNAVPVRLGEVAGLTVSAAMDLLESSGWKPQRQAEEPYRIVYIQSHVRTRQWFKDGQTFVWEEGEQNTAQYAGPKTKRKSTVLKKKNVEGTLIAHG